MATHRTRVGLHARNAMQFPGHDFELIRRARIETMKMMSLTDIAIYDRLRKENPGIEFIVRLYDDRFGRNSRPSPAEFVARMIPIINRLRAYASKFEIHNEPNHVDGIEGWGASDDNARSFRAWYVPVLSALKKACPWARFGFPGLALNQPHRDLAWLDICREAVEASHWLGCHCYWQRGNLMNDQWGLRFKLYHQRFPNKQIEITEFGNSTPGLPPEEMASQYVQYYQELNKYPYLGSASAFIASSPDPAWAQFVWMKEGGEMLPVVHQVGQMKRVPVQVAPPPAPPVKPEPVPVPAARTFAQTGKTVRGKFLEFLDRYGLDICGYPITEQFKEDGLQSQYFQRMALEQLESGELQLKLVGTEAWLSRSKIAGLKARIQELGLQLLALGPARPPIRDIVAQLPTHATHRYATRSLADINQIVIHHTATEATLTPQRLAEYQVRTQNRAGILYHFCVAADGTIYQTNRLDTLSEHAADRSQESIGICFLGDFTTSIPTVAQLEAGGQLCAWLVGSLRLPTSAIVGLREFAKTQSPGEQWLSGQRWKDKLLQEVRAALTASQDEQSAVILSLQAQVKALQEEFTRPQPFSLAAMSFAETARARISPPTIENLIDKLPKHDTKQYKTRPLRNITHLVIHHSAVPPSVLPKRIAQYHVSKQDWPGIGYHFLVGEDGTLYQGNALETMSYHAVKANPYSAGICFLGNFTKTVPPPAQLRAGAHLAAWLMQELGIPLDNMRGHKEYMDTACPGEQWLKGQMWKRMLRQEIAQVQQEAAAPSPAPPPPEPTTGEVKLFYHYMLFWAHDKGWAETDWLNAQNYVGAFRPTVGFSAADAAHAEYVTIVGGPLGVSQEVEDWLKAAGCQVERIAGEDEAGTKQILDELVKQDRRFHTFEE